MALNMFSWFEKLFQSNTEQYAAAMNLIYDNNIHTLRKKVKILIVDDEKFDTIDMLKERKYDIYYKNDITYAIEAEAFDIIIIDIIGIGKALGSAMGGFAVAEEIKKYYPAKQVWCYSGSMVKQEIATRIDHIDGYIPKDTAIDQWCEKLDNIITRYCDREYMIGVLEKELKKYGIEDEKIDKIIKEYRNNLEHKNFNSVIDLLTKTVENGKNLIGLIKSIYTFAEHFTS